MANSALVLAGILIVLNKGNASVHLLDAKSGKLLAQVSVGPNPHEVAICPDGRTVIVGDYQGGLDNSLTLIDIVSLAPTQDPQSSKSKCCKLADTLRGAIAT